MNFLFITYIDSHLSASLDDSANNVAKATFDVIEEATVRTADMGGNGIVFLFQLSFYNVMIETGSATTSEFTEAILKKL